ncbi:hypothetical protein BV394_02200 [Brevirhabdus pacifica]|uniref:Uncharacterized protein n=1 Tax=Brevirhabdus pacifica TaxID=1267768 RepID=A0A1U7DFL1_9RHOB|nr:neutral zinc metallopeptidase [Brevirhabdus pacifica]APX88689.1 hypothetical protein BV394_02200 [Brevirhabdus pacifica]OWU79954.1 membrane protein [Loktanella sp. 22II-4b]PJJ86801.1 hypothetical protein CLV77_1358 [Brevirhabdus pacifica]
MRWQGRRGSSNIEDRRGMRSAGIGRVGGAGGLGILAVVVVGYFLGVDLTPLLGGGGGGFAPVQSGGGQITEADRQAGEFVSVTLADTEEVWANVFSEQVNRPYQPATLVLFKGVTQSPCGGASGATGPFYCPTDQKIYLDTAFFTTMRQQLGAGGDFAAAYVVGHEVAHHVQNELGILERTTRARQGASETQSNAISVRTELQADCLSGLWARRAEARFGSLEPGDIEEAMNAAGRIGDDALQRGAGRVPMPDSFTHGTSEQRQRWFSRGYESPKLETCDTFNARQL